MRRKMSKKLLAFLLTATMILSTAAPAFAEEEETATENPAQVEALQEEIAEEVTEAVVEAVTEDLAEDVMEEETAEVPTETEVTEEESVAEESLDPSTDYQKIIYDSSKKAYVLVNSEEKIDTTYNGVSPVQLVTKDKEGSNVYQYVYLKNGVQDKKANGLFQDNGYTSAYYFKSGIQELSFNSKKDGLATIENAQITQWFDMSHDTISGKVTLYVSNGVYDNNKTGVYRVKNNFYYFWKGILWDSSVSDLHSALNNHYYPINGLVMCSDTSSDLTDDDSLPAYKKLPKEGFYVLIKNGKMDTSANGAYIDFRGYSAYLTKGAGPIVFSESNPGKEGYYMGTYYAEDETTVSTLVYFHEGQYCDWASGFVKYGKSYYFMKDGLSPQDTISIDGAVYRPFTGVVDQDGVEIAGVKGTDNMLYVNKGKLDLTKTGLVSNGCESTDPDLYYVEKGVWNSTFCSDDDGLVKLALKYDSEKHKSANVDVYVRGGKYSYTNSDPGFYVIKDKSVYIDAQNWARNNNYKNYWIKAANAKADFGVKTKTYKLGVMPADDHANFVVGGTDLGNRSYWKVTNGIWDRTAAGGYAWGRTVNGGTPTFEGYYMKDGKLDTTFTGLAKTKLTMAILTANEQKNTVSYKTKNYSVICYYEDGVLVNKTGIAKLDNDFYLVKNGVVPSVTLVKGSMDAVTGIFHVEDEDDLLTKDDEGCGLHPEVSTDGYDYGIYFKNGKFIKYTGSAYRLDEAANVVVNCAGYKYKEKVNKGIYE